MQAKLLNRVKRYLIYCQNTWKKDNKFNLYSSNILSLKDQGILYNSLQRIIKVIIEVSKIQQKEQKNNNNFNSGDNKKEL